jgi:hypothetical protein
MKLARRLLEAAAQLLEPDHGGRQGVKDQLTARTAIAQPEDKVFHQMKSVGGDTV